jgi:hypothetical protein
MRMPHDIDRKDKIERAIAESARDDPLVLSRRQNLDLNLWSSYRARYDLRPVFENLDVPTSIELQYFNGEQEDLFFPQDDASKHELRTVPRYVNIKLTSLGKEVDLDFDEEESLSTFRRLGAGGVPIEMVFRREFQNGVPMFGVYLRTAHETVELTKLKMKFFSL